MFIWRMGSAPRVMCHPRCLAAPPARVSGTPEYHVTTMGTFADLGHALHVPVKTKTAPRALGRAASTITQSDTMVSRQHISSFQNHPSKVCATAPRAHPHSARHMYGPSCHRHFIVVTRGQHPHSIIMSIWQSCIHIRLSAAVPRLRSSLWHTEVRSLLTKRARTTAVTSYKGGTHDSMSCSART